MYDFDQDHEVDNDWMGFLSEFLMPLNTAEEDDEKSDPEYVAAESVTVDREELRPVRVSKKELNQLISELLEDTSLNFDSEPSTSYKSQQNKNKRQRTSSPPRSKPQSPKISSKLYVQQELNTPPILHEQSIVITPEHSTSTNKKLEKPRTSLDTIDKDIYQQQMLTPQRMGFSTPTVMQSPVIYSSPPSVFFPPELMTTPEAPVTPSKLSSTVEAKIPQITGVYGSAVPDSCGPPQAPQILIVNAQNQLEIQSSANLMSQAFCKNGVMQLPQFQSIVIQVPTIDLLGNRLNLSSIVTPSVETLRETNETSTKQEDTMKSRKHCKREKLSEFEYLEAEPPPTEVTFESQLSGFTPEQRNIYEQQMRIHAQLLSQHYIQVYSNPKWWERSKSVKENLAELKTAVNPMISPHTAAHVDECLKLCDDWENQLEENNDRNKKYAEYLYQEHDLDVIAFEDRLSFKGRFHPRLMEHMLSSKAIIYTKLLPTIPFRAVSINKIEPTNSELRLLAFGLERFYREQYEKLNSLNPYRLREPTIGGLSRDIIREYKSFRTSNCLIKIIEGYKNHAKMNPIKYFFIHKKAPPYKLEMEDIDLDFIVPPKNLRRGLLPKTWDAYMFSHERVSLTEISSNCEVKD